MDDEKTRYPRPAIVSAPPLAQKKELINKDHGFRRGCGGRRGRGRNLLWSFLDVARARKRLTAVSLKVN